MSNYRRSESGFYSNPNRSVIEQAQMKKKLRQQQKAEEQNMSSRLDVVESDISEIKELLKALVSKNL